MDKVVFLDRDGTINEEVNYLYRPEDFRFLPGVPQALKMLTDAGFRLIVVTNQAGVARGYYTEEDVKNLHRYVNGLLESYGTGIHGFYYCPHHPEHGLGLYKRDCRCRKPDIGMFQQAEADMGTRVDKAHSYMIGDKLLDTQAGRRYGVPSILVGTGYGAEFRRQSLLAAERFGAAGGLGGPGTPGGADGPNTSGTPDYDHYAENLTEAARWILQREGEHSHE